MSEARKQEVWRMVDKMATRCTDCRFNEKSVLYSEDTVIGIEYRCVAKDEICDFTKTKIDSQTWYGSAKEAYADNPETEGAAE